MRGPKSETTRKTSRKNLPVPQGKQLFQTVHERLNPMATATQTLPELMTKKQLAEFLQCSQRQCEILTGKGRLPKPIYLGESSPRWKRDEVLEHLEDSRTGGDA